MSTITIPVNVPTTGDYSLEHLTHLLTQYAVKLVSLKKDNAVPAVKKSWRNREISPEIKSISLGKSALSESSLTDKELLEQALEEKYL